MLSDSGCHYTLLARIEQHLELKIAKSGFRKNTLGVDTQRRQQRINPILKAILTSNFDSFVYPLIWWV